MMVFPSLSTSAPARYAIGAIMYFAQGIPQGLLAISIPVWLASQGVGAGAIGSYLAVITLPWAFKLVTGPLMDRYEFLPMGRRRPWVIGAQAGLSLSLLALMLIDKPAEQVGLLMLIGALINTFAATQDVAVDGMAIDLTPIREQGRLNAFMSFGKSIGWASTAAVTGVLLTVFGLGVTATIAAAVAALPLLAAVLLLERDGERRLPWTRGDAAPVQRAEASFRAVFREINGVLWTRASIVIMCIMFFDGLVFGYGQALMPIAAVNLFGYTTAQWSQLVAMMGLTGAVLALGVGPMIDRMGAKRMLLLAVSLLALHAFLIAQTQHLWDNSLYARVILSFWIMMIPIVMVSTLALAMAVCTSVNSATQFAIYMSVANFGHAAGSKIYGTVADASSYVQAYSMLSAIIVMMIVVLLFHRHHEGARRGGGPASGDRPVARHTLSVGGTDAGMFFSGAMRCPKCRADMQAITIDGTEIDRCTICHGIWFDAGEIDALKHRKAARTIDIGDSATGAAANALRQYDCPRCSGTMRRVTDPQQTHIAFETCSRCDGSYLDAGELRDLSTLTIGEFFNALRSRRTDPAGVPVDQS